MTVARIRTIKPSFFESEDVAVLPFRARLLWIGLWTHCDDEGRTKDNVRLIKAWIWPLDQVTLRDIDEDLAILAGAGRIVRYEADGQRYLEITNWREHQSINKPTPSKIPPPPGLREDSRSRPGSVREGSRRAPVAVPEDSGQEGNGKEGKGRDARAREAADVAAPSGPGSEPPSKCDEHIDDPDPPSCGACAGRRRAHETWEREQLRATTLRRQAEAQQQREANARAIESCRRCDTRGQLTNGMACNHQPEPAPNAAAAARAAISQRSRREEPDDDPPLADVLPIRRAAEAGTRHQEQP